MCFVNGHLKAYYWQTVQNVPRWSVGSYYRQVDHFENFQQLLLVLVGINFQNHFMFSLFGSGKYFRKKSQISNHKKQINPNCQISKCARGRFSARADDFKQKMSVHEVSRIFFRKNYCWLISMRQYQHFDVQKMNLVSYVFELLLSKPRFMLSIPGKKHAQIRIFFTFALKY